MPFSFWMALAGTVRQSWRYPTTSPCSNSRPIPLNSTRWKMCGLICVPTSSPYPSSTIMSRSSTGVAKHGTSLQTTKPQSRQSLPDNGPKRSTTRALVLNAVWRANCPVLPVWDLLGCRCAPLARQCSMAAIDDPEDTLSGIRSVDTLSSRGDIKSQFMKSSSKCE